MRKIKDSIRRYFILSKRLLKKKGFVAILLFVPLLTAAIYGAASKGDSGVLTVALALENDSDELSESIVNELMEEDSLIRFVLFEGPSAASEAVSSGKAEAAWIFEDRMEDKIEDFANHTHANNAFVRVVQREENLLLQISREKLNSVLYPSISLALYKSYTADMLGDEAQTEALDNFYRSVEAEGEELFEFVYTGAGGAYEKKEDGEMNLLASPLRGLLAITVLFGGIAVGMFYMQDEERGAFDRFSRKERFGFSLIYHASAVAMVGAAALVALVLMKFSVRVDYELLVMAVYCFTTVGFCVCLRLIFKGIRLFAAVTPVLVVIMVIFCPVFFATPKNIPVIQYLLPPYYYLNAILGANFVWYMALYGAALYALAFILNAIRTK